MREQRDFPCFIDFSLGRKISITLGENLDCEMYI